MKRAYQALSKGFTLIELLVVITILGILVTLALVTINPAEAQKKARDTQRLKDVATLQSIVEQFIADNPGAGTTFAASRSDTGGTTANKCGTAGWLSQALKISGNPSDLCKYANVMPVDPVNRDNAQVTNSSGAPITANAHYYFAYASGGYKICTYLESTANGSKLTNDGEGTINSNASTMFAIFSADIQCP